MRYRTVFILLLVATLVNVCSSFKHHHHQLINYLLLSQLGGQRKLVVVPLIIPVPVGIFRHFRSMRYHSAPAEIVINTASNCNGPICTVPSSSSW